MLTDDSTITLETEADGNLAIFYISGELYAEASIRLDRLLAEQLMSQVRFVIFDFQNLTFLGSSGIGSLIELVDQLDKSGKALVCGASEPVRKTLDLVGVSSFVEYYDVVEDAKVAVYDRYL